MATAVEPSPPSALCKQVSQGSLSTLDNVEPLSDLQDIGTSRWQRHLPPRGVMLSVLYTAYSRACLYRGCSRFRLRFDRIQRYSWQPTFLHSNIRTQARLTKECLLSASKYSACWFRNTGTERVYTRFVCVNVRIHGYRSVRTLCSFGKCAKCRLY